jgi:ubiquinone/menaquinone biosynthesis C-methylase UbiE
MATFSDPRTGEGQCQDSAGLRARVHGMWASVAASWGEHAGYADARAARVTARMLESSAPAPGERVLELACGPGGAGLAAARLVGPDGHVVLSDVVEEMTSIAGRRAEALGLRTISTRVLDLEQIDEPDASYDVVLCREGLMFAVDPAAGAREIGRVLRPGGRLAVAVWGPRARNPWLGLIFDVVSAQVGKPVPPPGVPGPFSLDEAERLAGVLRAGGIADVRVEEVDTPLWTASFEEWWTRTRGLAGPLTAILASLPQPALQVIEARLREAVAPYETPDGLELPGVTLLATGRRSE